LVVKTVAQLEFRCSDITVCTLRTGKAYCLWLHVNRIHIYFYFK
jgi:hypothetical protein